MKAFMDEDFLLSTDTAKRLFEQAKDCPIIDYHCHISPREIWEDLHYKNITQVWLGGDHYKWRLMRCAGVEEKFITGDASDYEKFMAWARVIGRAIGNPLYHWSHLELQRYFGYYGILNEKTADEVWNLVNEKLQKPEFGVRGLISMSNVETVCTTDDPADTLEWHEKLAADPSFRTAVLPAWRPDKAMNLEKPEWPAYLEQLSNAAGIRINSFADLKAALAKRMEYFNAHHCCLSDHGLNYLMCEPASEAEVEAVYAARMAGKPVDAHSEAIFKTALLRFCAAQYVKYGWVMQLHYGCIRNTNHAMYEKLGVDCGFDTMGNYTPAAEAAAMLGLLEREGCLPKTILYSLNANDNQVLDTLCGCFQNSDAVCRIQHGSAWWFNDTLTGMTEQLTSFANLGYLAGFVGMLTDSRSFLSYPRHEYFRRILCRLLGEWVEDGRFPNDEETLAEIVRNISYYNAKEYFRFAAK